MSKKHCSSFSISPRQFRCDLAWAALWEARGRVCVSCVWFTPPRRRIFPSLPRKNPSLLSHERWSYLRQATVCLPLRPSWSAASGRSVCLLKLILFPFTAAYRRTKLQPCRPSAVHWTALEQHAFCANIKPLEFSVLHAFVYEFIHNSFT